MERSVCDLTSFLHLIGVMFMLMELNTGLILAKIVPSPLIRYAHENEDTRLECHNVSQSNEFYNFAKNVKWYRLVDGVHHNIGTSDRVYASSHILFFDSFMSEFDQGQYECCVPQEGCSGPASITLVVDPIAEVVATNYVGFEGHSVVLACKIIYIGMPPASFYWERHNQKVTNRDITTNDTHTLLALTNLTRGDSGEYQCVADGPLSLERYSVYIRLQAPPKVMIYGPGSMVQTGTKVQLTCSQLEGKPANISLVTPSNTVIQHSMITFTATPNDTGNYLCVASVSSINVTASHYLHVYDIDNTTSLIPFAVEIHNDYCRHEPKLFERKLRVLLEDEILRICRCNVTVTSSGYQCIGYSRALYNVTITGVMAGNIKDFIEHSHLAPELDLQIATVYVCNQSCNGLVTNTNTTHNVSHDGDGDDNDESTTSNNTHNNNITSILAISIASCAMVFLCLILGTLVYRIKQTDKMTTYCVVCSYIQEKSIPTKTDSQIFPGSIVEHKSKLMNASIPNETAPATQSVMDTIKSYPEESIQPMKYQTTLEAIEEQSVSRRDYIQHSDMNRNVTAPYGSPEEVLAKQQMPSAFTYLSDVSDNRSEHTQCKSNIDNDDANSREVNTTAEVGTTTSGKQHHETTL